MKPKVENQPKKPYHAPVLQVYGSIQALTKAVGNTSTKGDNGTFGSYKKTA